MWPMVLDIPKEECQKALRSLELEAYGGLISALRGQGELSSTRRQLLQDAATVLHIGTERHKAEVRRAVNDEKLATIADRIAGPNTQIHWTIEGKRTIPLMHRVGRPHTAVTALADSVAEIAADNANMPAQNPAQHAGIEKAEEVVAASSPESSRSMTTNLSTATPKEYQQISKVNGTKRKRPLSPEEPAAQLVERCVATRCSTSQTLNRDTSTSSDQPSPTTSLVPPLKPSADANEPTEIVGAPISTQKLSNSGTTTSNETQQKFTATPPGGIVIILRPRTRFNVGDVLTLTQDGETIVGKVLRTGALPAVQNTFIGGIRQVNEAQGKVTPSASNAFKMVTAVSSTPKNPNEAAASIPGYLDEKILDESSERCNSPSSSTDTAPSPELNEENDLSFGEESKFGESCMEHENTGDAGSTQNDVCDTDLKAESAIATSDGNLSDSDEDFRLYYSSSDD